MRGLARTVAEETAGGGGGGACGRGTPSDTIVIRIAELQGLRQYGPQQMGGTSFTEERLSSGRRTFVRVDWERGDRRRELPRIVVDVMSGHAQPPSTRPRLHVDSFSTKVPGCLRPAGAVQDHTGSEDRTDVPA